IEEVTDTGRLQAIQAGLNRVLADVRAAVEDWGAMRARIAETIDSFTTQPPPVPADEIREAADFLRWMDEDNFTFLGCRDYEFEGTGPQLRARPVPGSSLGILRPERTREEGAPAGLEALPAEVLGSLKQPVLLD